MPPNASQLSVAAFNERAIVVYERAGFARGSRAASTLRTAVCTQFVTMARQAD